MTKTPWNKNKSIGQKIKQWFCKHIWLNMSLEDTKNLMVKPSSYANLYDPEYHNKLMEIYEGKTGKDQCAKCAKERIFRI